MKSQQPMLSWALYNEKETKKTTEHRQCGEGALKNTQVLLGTKRRKFFSSL